MYRTAEKEAAVQDFLARELGRQGWEVLREVSCRPARDGWRRIDVYATADLPWCDVLPGFVLGVECKHDLGVHNGYLTESFNQVYGYLSATSWTTKDCAEVPRPDHIVLTTTAMLAGIHVPDHTGKQEGHPWMDAHMRHLWNIGGSMLWRQGDDLVTTIRRGARDTRGRLTTKDTLVKLTNWHLR